MEKISEHTHVYKPLCMSFSIFSIWHEKYYLTVASLFIPSDYIWCCPSFQILAISISYFVNNLFMLLPKFLAFPSYPLHLHFHTCYLQYSNLIWGSSRLFYTTILMHSELSCPSDIWLYHADHQKKDPFLKEREISFVNDKLNY